MVFGKMVVGKLRAKSVGTVAVEESPHARPSWPWTSSPNFRW
jgi:hypothetical protein